MSHIHLDCKQFASVFVLVVGFAAAGSKAHHHKQGRVAGDEETWIVSFALDQHLLLSLIG